MRHRQRRARLAPALAAFALCLALPVLARAQDETPPRPAAAPRADEINHEIQLYLLAPSGDAGARGQLPEPLAGVARQLRAALPAAGYRVAFTALHRVRNGGGIEFRGVGPHLFTPAGASPPAGLPLTVLHYRLNAARLAEDASGGRFIHVRALNFGARVPVQSGAAPAIQWEEMSLSTEVSVREGEPTVVGTITTGRPDEPLVLVVTIRRAGR